MRTYQLIKTSATHNGRYDPRTRGVVKFSPAMCCNDFIIYYANHYICRSGQVLSINRTYLNSLAIGGNIILPDWEIYVSYIPGKLQTNTLQTNGNCNVYYQQYIIYHR